MFQGLELSRGLMETIKSKIVAANPRASWVYSRTQMVILSLLLLALDYVTGPQIRFPAFFVLPVILAAWNQGRRTAYLIALVLPTVRVLFSFAWVSGVDPLPIEIVNALIQISIFSLIGYGVGVISKQRRELEERVKTLEGILPICCYCKKIRDTSGSWQILEAYISTHSSAEFSHALCDACAQQHYPEIFATAAHKKNS